jgi:Cytochrome C oxidase subunit II, transmembrane domain
MKYSNLEILNQFNDDFSLSNIILSSINSTLTWLGLLMILVSSIIIVIMYYLLLNGNDECCCGHSCDCCSCSGYQHQKPELPKKVNFKSDVPLAWGLYFQDGATPSFEGIVDLHNRIMFYLVVILFGVSWVMLSIMWNFNKSENKLVYRYLNHGTLIELIWTVGPALVLVAIAFPSFKLLYLMDK